MIPKKYKSGLFADRDTVDEAMDFAQQLLQFIPEECQCSAYTALSLVVNTAIKVQQNFIDELNGVVEEEYAGCGMGGPSPVITKIASIIEEYDV